MSNTVIWWLGAIHLLDTMAHDEEAEAGGSVLPILPGHIRDVLDTVFRRRDTLYTDTGDMSIIFNALPYPEDFPVRTNQTGRLGIKGACVGIRVSRDLSGFIKHYPGVITDENFSILKASQTSTRLRLR